MKYTVAAIAVMFATVAGFMWKDNRMFAITQILMAAIYLGVAITLHRKERRGG